MVFLTRYVQGVGIFSCCYNGVQIMPKKATRRMKIQQDFDKKPKEVLIQWARRIFKELIMQTGDESCGVHSFTICPEIDIIELKYKEKYAEEVYVTGVIYRILRQRARGTWHIYGLSDKEFHKRMKEKGFNIKQSKEMLNLFKEDRIKTKAKL